MAQRRPSTLNPVPPTLPPLKAIELLRKQLDRINDLSQLSHDNPEVKKWNITTENILHVAFGKPDGDAHDNTREFRQSAPLERFHESIPETKLQESYVKSLSSRKALLESYIEQLQDFAPPSAATASDQYHLHPEIERVSGKLYRDGHFKQAALEAYIRVIDEVKARSGLRLDGDALMNRAFGCDSQTPVIQFNDLQTDAERDEQRGFMFLFKGIVGLRNSKAHSNRLFNDPWRAHDYLALASLLMRIFEIAAVNRP